jgi:hypothetical protein
MPKTRSNRRKRNEKRAKKMRGGVDWVNGPVETVNESILYNDKPVVLKSITLLPLAPAPAPESESESAPAPESESAPAPEPESEIVDIEKTNIFDWLKTDVRFTDRKADFIIQLDINNSVIKSAREIKGRRYLVDSNNYDRNYVYTGSSTPEDEKIDHPHYNYNSNYRKRCASMQIKGLDDRDFSFIAVLPWPRIVISTIVDKAEKFKDRYDNLIVDENSNSVEGTIVSIRGYNYLYTGKDKILFHSNNIKNNPSHYRKVLYTQRFNSIEDRKETSRVSGDTLDSQSQPGDNDFTLYIVSEPLPANPSKGGKTRRKYQRRTRSR